MEGKYDNDLYDGTWVFYNKDGTEKIRFDYKKGVLLNQGRFDSLQMKELETLEQMKGKIKDPEKFRDNPEEYLRK